MKKLLLVDMDKCTGCKQCSLACSLTKEGLFDNLRSRIKIFKREDIAIGLPLLCEQCEEYPCVASCPEGALSRDDDTGVISVEVEICTGCQICGEACPYHAIYYHPETGVALICDLCGGEPYCVDHCVPGALEWVDWSEEALKKKRELREKRMKRYEETKEVVA